MILIMKKYVSSKSTTTALLDLSHSAWNTYTLKSIMKCINSWPKKWLNVEKRISILATVLKILFIRISHCYLSFKQHYIFSFNNKWSNIVINRVIMLPYLDRRPIQLCNIFFWNFFRPWSMKKSQSLPSPLLSAAV